MENKKHDNRQIEPDRRSFLKLAGAGTVLGGAAVVAAGSAEAADAEAPAGSGYRETEHVRKVYETARF